MHTIRKTSLIALSLWAFACSSEPGNDGKVDIGDRDVAVLGEKLSDFSGEWDGYMEAFTLGHGSDRIRITLGASGEGAVRFGDANEAPPLSPDPVDAYPATDDPADFESKGGRYPVDGYPYTVQDSALVSRRFRFAIHLEDAHEPWCAQYASLPAGTPQAPDYRSCVGMSRVEFDATGACTFVHPVTSEVIPVECSTNGFSLCQVNCECDATSCHAIEQPPINFDGVLEDGGDSFVGTMVYQRAITPSYPPRVTVRLTRQVE